jgi:hypothetical protein
MTDPVTETIEIANAQERLRQERETFDQRKEQDARYFKLRMAMGWIAVVLLPAIGVTCGWIIFHSHEFTSGTVGVAATALLVDALGLVVSVWKIVMGSGPQALEPVTAGKSALPASRSRKSS